MKFYFFLILIVSSFIALKAEEVTFYKSNAWGEKIELTENKNWTWLLEEKKEKDKEEFILFYKGELFYTLIRNYYEDKEEETYLYPNGKKRVKILQNNKLQEDIYTSPLGKEFKTLLFYDDENLERYKRDSLKTVEKNPWGKISLLEGENKKLFVQKETLYSFFPSRIKTWEWNTTNKISTFNLKGTLLSQERNSLLAEGSRERVLQKANIKISQVYSSLGILEKEEKEKDNQLLFSKKWLWGPSLLLISYEEKENDFIKKITFNYENNKIIRESIFLNNQLRQIISFEKDGKRIENFNKKGEILGVFFLPKEEEN